MKMSPKELIDWVRRCRADPSKWKMVPIEPTEEMLLATLGCWTQENKGLEACAKEMYRVMLAKAPNSYTER